MTAGDLRALAPVCGGLAVVQRVVSKGPRAATYWGNLVDAARSMVLLTVVDEVDDSVIDEFRTRDEGPPWDAARVLGAGRADDAKASNLAVLVESRPDGHPLTDWWRREPIDLHAFASVASRLCSLLWQEHDAGGVVAELWPSHVFLSASVDAPALTRVAIRGSAFVRAGLGVHRAAEEAGMQGVPCPPEMLAGEPASPASAVFCIAALLTEWLDRAPSGQLPTHAYRPLALDALREALAPALDPDPARRPQPGLLSDAVWDVCRIPHPAARWRGVFPDEASESAPPTPSSGGSRAGEWSPGEIVEGVYKVEPVMEGGRQRVAHESGGMGLVYRMRHLAWGTDVAVKVPRPELFRTEQQRAAFEAEVDTWVRLGLHPHVVDCHYLRRIDGLPCVFSAYRAGGTLATHLAEGKPYAGDDREPLARVLDLAIQTAWGLAHAHRTGVVHQDVKPGNVLLEDDVAQVSDFGLAQALGRTAPEAASRASDELPPDRSIVVPGGGGMTPAYASPEQFARGPLTPATDVWSWALMVLELFCGERRWAIGPAAPESLAMVRAGDARVVPPRDVLELLAGCLDADPSRRPRDLGAVALTLRWAWEQHAGDAYPREEPEPTAVLADGLSNEALSMIDLGRPADAEDRWQRALAADARHPHAVFNRGLHEWRRGVITDVDLVDRLEDLARSHEHDWTDEFLLGLVHAERGDGVAARRLFDEIERHAPDDPALRDAKAALDADPAPVGLRQRFASGIRVIRSVALTEDAEYVVAGGWGGVEVWHVPSGLRLGALERDIDGARVDVHAVAVTAAPVAPNRAGLLVAYAGYLPSMPRVEVANVSISGFPAALDRGGSKGRYPWESAPWWRARTMFPMARARSLSFDDEGEIRLEGPQPTEAVDASNRWRVSTDPRGVFRLFDHATGRCVRTFREHQPRVRSVAIAASGEIAVTGDDHGLICVWQLPGADARPRVPWSYARPRAAREVSEAATLVRRALADADAALAAGEVRRAASTIAAARAEPGWQRDRELVAAWHRAGARGRRGALTDAWVSSVRSAPVRHALEFALPGFQPTRIPVNAVVASADGQLVLTARSASLQLWEAGTDEPRFTISLADAPPDRIRADEGGVVLRPQEIRAACMTPDARLALTAAQGDAIRMWDLRAGAAIGALGDREVHSIGIDATGSFAVAAGWRSKLELWDVDARSLIATLDADGVIGALALAADTHTCITACARQVTAWDLDARTSRPFEPSNAPARTLAITPDARFCAVGLEGGAVEVFHVAAGRRVATMEPRAGASTTTAPQVAISADGRTVVASGRESVEVWNVVGDGRRVLDVPSSGSEPSGRPIPVAITGDATAVLGAAGDGALVTWTLDWSYDFDDNTP